MRSLIFFLVMFLVTGCKLGSGVNEQPLSDAVSQETMNQSVLDISVATISILDQTLSSLEAWPGASIEHCPNDLSVCQSPSGQIYQRNVLLDRCQAGPWLASGTMEFSFNGALASVGCSSMSLTGNVSSNVAYRNLVLTRSSQEVHVSTESLLNYLGQAWAGGLHIQPEGSSWLVNVLGISFINVSLPSRRMFGSYTAQSEGSLISSGRRVDRNRNLTTGQGAALRWDDNIHRVIVRATTQGLAWQNENCCWPTQGSLVLSFQTVKHERATVTWSSGACGQASIQGDAGRTDLLFDECMSYIRP